MTGMCNRSWLVFLVAGLVLVVGSSHVSAQEAEQGVSVTPSAQTDTAAEADTSAEIPEGSGQTAEASQNVDPEQINPNSIPSVLFTHWEHAAISDAKRFRGETRSVTEFELKRDIETRQSDKPRPPPEKREIKLGGIVYVKSDDWTIWLNNQRVTPKAIPPEVMDLKVHKEYIEMKWFDDYTNQIFPLRLRTHQRFNIDSRVFLPG